MSDVNVTADDVKDAIENDPDFIALARFDCSLAKFVERYPDGAPSNVMIAKALCTSEEDVENIYQEAMKFLKIAFTQETDID